MDSHPLTKTAIALVGKRDTDLPAKFDIGQVVATPGALAALEEAEQNAFELLSRHASGDWGELSDAAFGN
jgi:hypothetical protein